MTYKLIAKVNSNEDWYDRDIYPEWFVLELTDSIVKELAGFARETKKIKHPKFSGAIFSFHDGFWAKSNEEMEKYDEFAFEDKALPELEEVDVIECLQVRIDQFGTFWFTCCNKYSGDEFFTCSFSMKEIKKTTKEEKK